MRFFNRGKIPLSTTAIKLAAKDLELALSQGASSVRAAEHAVAAALREDAKFDHPVAGPKQARITLSYGQCGSGQTEHQYSWMREALRTGHSVVMVSNRGTSLYARFQPNEVWYWNHQNGEACPADMGAQCGLVFIEPYWKVLVDPLGEVLEHLENHLAANVVLLLDDLNTDQCALLSPLLKEKPGWALHGLLDARSQTARVLAEIVDQIVEGKSCSDDAIFPGQDLWQEGYGAVVTGPKAGFIGDMPYRGRDLRIPPPLWSEDARKLRDSLANALTQGKPQRHIEGLNLISRSAGYRDWHAAEGRWRLGGDWTK